MNDIELFKSDEFGQVRVVMVEVTPWFVGKDVAEVLGYKNTRDALMVHVDEEDKTVVVIHDGSQNRNVVAINESGLYSLIFSSKLPKAKDFKRWVTSEVLPNIRKTGTYTKQERQKEINESLVFKHMDITHQLNQKKFEDDIRKATGDIMQLQTKITRHELSIKDIQLKIKDVELEIKDLYSKISRSQVDKDKADTEYRGKRTMMMQQQVKHLN